MTEQFCVAEVAIENASYSYDKLYDYLIPPGLEAVAVVGCRVKVSFGRGLRQGMIIGVHKTDDISGLKSIARLIDKEPVLSPELIALAAFMREHCFCTWFDACAAMLPSGLSVRLTYSYSLSGDSADADSFAAGSVENAVLSFLSGRKKPVAEDRIKKALSLEDDAVLRRLSELGYLIRHEDVRQRMADATVKMVRLTGNIPGRKFTPAQSEVIRVLSETGEASLKELCYFTGVSRAVTDNLVKRGICEYFEAEPPRTAASEKTTGAEDIVLTPEQDRAYRALLGKYESGQASVSLLYGVTGSGKTSVFMKLIDRVNAGGRGVICMVPEISLTPQLLSKFRARYGSRVAVFHSALSIGKRLEEWRRVKNGEATIAVGTRSAIFAPLSDVGLIVMDEEQEYSYKSSASPRFHARELAKFRCVRNNCPLVLSSATPAVESYHYALSGRYSLMTIGSRYGGAVLPHVVTADMNIERDQGNTSIFSSVLLEAIEQNLEDGNQSIILLNRRGHNTFVSCRSCRETVSCPNCSISLTYHSANNRLMCHYCGYSIPHPDRCPACGSEKLRFGGSGTQRAEQELGELFPKARIMRLDTDSTMQKYAYEKKLGDFRDGRYDIMLGTQMVAKGLDFPRVTLVGVLSADVMMHGNDFRSYERTFALLTQVAGRSGRGGLEGRAIIQTYEPENPVISLAAAQDYDAFFRSEIVLRRSMLYPPFTGIAVVVFSCEERKTASAAADYFAGLLAHNAAEQFPQLPLRVLGPASAGIPRVGGKYRYRLIIKFRPCRDFRTLMSGLLTDIGRKKEYSAVNTYIDIDPDTII